MHKERKSSSSWRVKISFWFFDSVLTVTSSLMALLLSVNFNYKDISVEMFHHLIFMFVPNVLIALILISAFRLNNHLWKYISAYELINILIVSLVVSASNMSICFLFSHEVNFKHSLFYFLIFFIFLSVSRYGYKVITDIYFHGIHEPGKRNTMIIGAGEAGCLVINELRFSKKLDADIRCIIDDDTSKHGRYLRGIKVVGGRDSIEYYAEKYGINEIIVAIPSASKRELKKISDICINVKNCEVKILPGIYQLVNGSVSVSQIRDLKIEDLLGREEVNLSNDEIKAYLQDKTVLVTGGGGSIGSELCRQIAKNGAKHLIIFDIYENNVYQLQQELIKYFPNLMLDVLIGSVRNRNRVQSIFQMYRPDIVYHAAAHKHVPLMEDSPNEAVKNNIFGTYEVALAAHLYKVKKFVLISTDKAVNPTNVMGASKRVCEMIIQFFSQLSDVTEYSAVRFGNVLGSNGSVIPLFRKQIESGGPVTITHPDIIRYFMTIEEAVHLVLRAASMNYGETIFVLDMGDPVRIVELAEKMIKLYGYEPHNDMEIKFIGLRPGEKLYEEPLIDLENLKKTEDNKIFMEAFRNVDAEMFIQQLRMIYEKAYSEHSNIRQILSDIVDTYKTETVLADQPDVQNGSHHKWDNGLGNNKARK